MSSPFFPRLLKLGDSIDLANAEKVRFYFIFVIRLSGNKQSKIEKFLGVSFSIESLFFSQHERRERQALVKIF